MDLVNNSTHLYNTKILHSKHIKIIRKTIIKIFIETSKRYKEKEIDSRKSYLKAITPFQTTNAEEEFQYMPQEGICIAILKLQSWAAGWLRNEYIAPTAICWQTLF